MDETGQALQVLNEVADISQRLDILSMMFFLTVIVVLGGLLVFVLFYRLSSSNSKADNSQNEQLLKALSDNTSTFRDAVESWQKSQTTYWVQNTKEHQQTMQVSRRLLQMSNSTLRSLRQIVIILEGSKLLDTKEMKTIKDIQDENLNI